MSESETKLQKLKDLIAELEKDLKEIHAILRGKNE